MVRIHPKKYCSYIMPEGFLIQGRAINAQEVVKKSRVVLAPLRLVLE
jgi:hypothetical protein